MEGNCLKTTLVSNEILIFVGIALDKKLINGESLIENASYKLLYSEDCHFLAFIVPI